MTDPNRLALAVVRLLAALNLFPGAALLLVGVCLLIPLSGIPLLAPLPFTLMMYGAVYVCSGAALWAFSANFARFAAKVFDRDPSIFS